MVSCLYITGRTKVESVQQKASKIIAYKKRTQFRNLSYRKRLQLAGWTSLERRVQVKQLKFIQRIFDKTFPDTPELGLVSNIRIGNRSRTIQPIGSRTMQHQSTLAIQAVSLYKTLPPSLQHKDIVLSSQFIAEANKFLRDTTRLSS